MNEKETNSKERFSNRVDNYSKYRPSYPNEIIDFLKETIGLTKNSVIADIGSGTGISSKIFLDNGNTVYGVEPNDKMREEGNRFLESYNNFYSIKGSSESTELKQESIDIVVAAQAFHWFDPKPTREEFLRILKPNGVVLLLWNRRIENSDFMKDYLKLLREYREKLKVSSDNKVIPEFFKGKQIETKIFYNPYKCNINRLRGELASYSYMPNEDDPRFNSMIKDLESIFYKYEYNGSVVLEYETEVYYCNIK